MQRRSYRFRVTIVTGGEGKESLHVQMMISSTDVMFVPMNKLV